MKIRGNPTQFIDRVPTEKTIFRLLNRDKDKISDKYELIQQPLAWLLNKDGVPATNKAINNVKSTGIRVFICQHVLVDKLQFRKNDVVFTTHATTANKYEAIPFYTVNADPKLVSASKKYKFSFLGSVWSKISISVKEKDIGNLNEIVKRYDYETMEAEMSKIYNKYFSNDVLHETVINVLSK